MILGSGPNRIGQGIEFDYCCCHASFALQEFGVESIMVNCNPETVSTDYDTSDRLYFEPLTLEEVLNIYDTEKPDGVIVQFGGQTPLNLALPLKTLGRADHRHRSREYRSGGRSQAVRQTARRSEDSVARATAPRPAWRKRATSRARIGFPVLVRPSYVLGGRAMVIAYDEDTVRRYMHEAVAFSQIAPGADRPLSRRCHRSGRRCALRWRERSDRRHYGAHRRGRRSFGRQLVRAAAVFAFEARARDDRGLHDASLRRALNVIGLMNVQYAIKDGEVYVLEVNPRASRTVPYVSKATGVPLPKIAVGLDARQEAGGFRVSDRRDRTTASLPVPNFFVKSPVFPFTKFPGVDPALGPEMRSTGEVMGVGENFGEAFAKAQLTAGTPLPDEGAIVHQRERSRQSRRRWKWPAIPRIRVSAFCDARNGGGVESRGLAVQRPFSK